MQFVQERTALARLYRPASGFAMVSFRENFGLVYAEALSQGRPVVYSKGQGFDRWCMIRIVVWALVPGIMRARLLEFSV